jgi:hypothetical protein
MKKVLILMAILPLVIFNCSKKTTTNNYYTYPKEGAIVGIVSPPESQAQITAYLGIPIASTQIDANGYFQLSGLPLGTYSLLVQADGYHDYLSPRNIPVTGEATASVDTIFLVSVRELIASVYPQDGAQGVRVTDPIWIAFRTNMNRESLESAFQVEPTVEGSFSWYSRTKGGMDEVRFTPSTKWATNTLYQVTIDTSASDLAGIKLLEPYQFSFTTEPLQVSYTYPAHNYTWVPPNTEISIRFNADMDVESVNSAFQMVDSQMNPVTGDFSWPGSDYMRFVPHSCLFVKTAYTVTIDTTASDIQGGKLPDRYHLYFSTQPIMIEATSPRNKETWVSTSVVIRIRFNTDMDMESVNSAFHMVHSEEDDVKGAFVWPYVYWLEFQPDSSLANDETYTVTIDATAKDMHGSNMDEPLSFWFKTRPEELKNSKTKQNIFRSSNTR